jgi:flagellar hook protein FlgE
MMTSFYTGVGGIKAQQFGLDTWGNNISNINTVGFRSSTPEFSTLFAQYRSGMAMSGMDEVGLGATAQTTALSMKQGSLVPTDRALDLAVSGNGWFGVQKANDDTQLFFTRAGDFYVDADSNVLNGNGDQLVGTYSGNMTIAKDGTATVTATSVASSNLLTDAKSQVALKFPKSVTHPGFPAVPATTATFPSYQLAITGGVGGNVTYTLPKQTTASISITDASGAVVRTLPQSTQGTGQHAVAWDGKDANGNIVPDGNYTVNISYVDKPYVAAVPKGNLKDYQVDANGMVVATFDNGQASVVAQIPLFHFQNEQGLEKIGDSEFRATDNSGQAFFYRQPDSSSKVAYKYDNGTTFNYNSTTGNVIQGGKIVSQNLEMSNVSTAEAMTQLIITEKAYSANARVITTADQMIQKAINLKRG